MKFLHLTWRNLGRRKLRTLLTVMSVLVAFLLFGYLAAIRNAFIGGVELAGDDRLMVRHRVSLIQLLPQSYEARIERIPGVKLAAHFTWFGGIYQDPKNFIAQFPCDPAKILAVYPEIVLPAEQLKAWQETRTGAIVGRKLVERYGWKIGQRIPIQGTIWPQKEGKTTWEFDVVGIYDGAQKGTDTSSMYFRYDYFNEARGFGEGLVGWYGVKIDDPNRAAEISEKIDAEFANSAAETKTEPEKAMIQGFAKQTGDIGAIMGAILTAVFFTILLVSGNTMAQAVRERTEELGVLKALGFTSGTVLVLVLMESCLLAAVGGGAGLGLALLLTAGGDPTPGYLPMFFIPRQDVLVGVGFILLLGLVSGALPAWQAMRLRIADALRR